MVILSLFLGEDSLWNGAGSCWGSLHTPRLEVQLLIDSDQGHIGGGAGLQEHVGAWLGASKVHAGPLETKVA